MIVFFGEKWGTNVNKLFTEDKGNDLFEGLFSKDQMDMIIKDNIYVTFSKQSLYIDDTIETVKKKMVMAFN